MKDQTIPTMYLGAFKKGHRFSSRDSIDEELSWDLLKRVQDSNGEDKEAHEALLYLSKFNNEYHKNVIKKDDPEALHNTDELRRDLYSRENAKNRDIMSVQNQTIQRVKYKSSDDLADIVEIEPDYDNWDTSLKISQKPLNNEFEDAMIDLLDTEILNPKD